MRAELLGQIVAAQFDIEPLLADLAQHGGEGLAQAQEQMRALVQMQRQIGEASPGQLTRMGGQVAATVAMAQRTASQARGAAAAAAAIESAELVHAAAEARAVAGAVFRDMHQFDPYLHFASADDERTYRQHEAERRAYMEAQQSTGTAHGALNANAAAIGQMADAKAHGAGDRPEFQQRWNELVGTTGRLREEVRRSSGSTKEFDDRLREDLRSILKAKGLTDAQIDAQFAVHPDPLEAAKTFVGGDDMRRLTRSINEIGNRAAAQPTTVVLAEEPAIGLSVVDVMANFRGNALAISDHPEGEAFAGSASVASAPIAKPNRSTAL